MLYESPLAALALQLARVSRHEPCNHGCELPKLSFPRVSGALRHAAPNSSHQFASKVSPFPAPPHPPVSKISLILDAPRAEVKDKGYV